MTIKTPARRACKALLYVMVFILSFRVMPKAEDFLNIDLASQGSVIVYGEDNIETLYDIFDDVDMLLTFFVAIIIYLAMVKSFVKIRK